MNIISKWTWRNIKLNRSRTLITIVGIILSAAMITAVATLCVSFQSYMIRQEMEDSGNWYGRGMGLSYEDAQKIAQDKRVNAVMLQTTLGVTKLYYKDNQEDKNFLDVAALVGVDQTMLENATIHLKEGAFPKNSREILISIDYIRMTETEYAVGDKFAWEIEGEPVEYTVSGIIQSTSVRPMEGGYALITLLDENAPLLQNDYTIFFRTENPRDIYKAGQDISKRLDSETIQYNSPLLRAYGMSQDDNINTVIYGIGGVMAAIIMIGSVALIYNSFSISVNERLRQFGMLSSIGATKKQLRNSVLFEGFVLAMFGIPLGILSGLVGIGITLKALKPFLDGVLAGTETFMMIVSWETVAGSFAVGMVTILISAWSPAKKVSKVSAIDSLRQANQIKIHKKDVKTSRIIKKLFGFEGQLALKNLKRDRRKYRSTVFSFFISIVLFITVSSFTMLLSESYGGISTDSDEDAAIAFRSGEYDNSAEIIQQLVSIKGIDQAYVYKIMSNTGEIPAAYLNPAMIRDLFDNPVDSAYAYITVYAMDNKSFAQFAEKEKIDLADYTDAENPRAILLNRTRYKNAKDAYVYAAIFKKNITPTISMSAGDEENAPQYEIEIAHQTQTSPVGVQVHSLGNRNYTEFILFVSEEVYADYLQNAGNQASEACHISVLTKEPDQVIEKAYAVFAQNDAVYQYIHNIANQTRSVRNIMVIVSVFCYGFITLITLIAVTNIINTISTNIGLRRREFAMLKSVGMTPKSFDGMIRFESLFYGMKALLYGVPCGIAISILLHYLLGFVFNGVAGMVPWGSILVCLAGIFAIVFSIMRYSVAKTKKENIINALKTETL